MGQMETPSTLSGPCNMLQELQVQRLQCNPAPAVMPFISSNKKRQDFFSFFWKKKKTAT
jgi:hypothetical protein